MRAQTMKIRSWFTRKNGVTAVLGIGIWYVFLAGDSMLGGAFLALAVVFLFRQYWKRQRNSADAGYTHPQSLSLKGRIIAFLGLDAYRDFVGRHANEKWLPLFHRTVGVGLTMIVALHLYLIPLLLADSNKVPLVADWVTFTDPFIGTLGGKLITVQNFTRDLMNHGYAHRVPLVRHVYGAVLLVLIPATLWMVIRLPRLSFLFRRAVREPVALTYFGIKNLEDRKQIKDILSFFYISFLFFSSFFADYCFLKTGINFNPSGMFQRILASPVHISNLALLEPAWFGPTVTHIVIPITLFLTIEIIGLLFFGTRKIKNK